MRLALNDWVSRRIGNDKLVFPEPGWRPGARFYLEPDFLIVPRRVLPPEFPGTDVLLAIEIADTSLAYDTTIKRDRYAALGVPEYWVVHAWDLTTRVHTGVRPGGYASVVERPPAENVVPSLIPEIGLRLGDLGIA